MKTTDLDDIRAVLRQVRRERHPDVPEAFIDAVLDAEAAALDDDRGALEGIRRAVAAQH
jgi:hypothetical protein